MRLALACGRADFLKFAEEISPLEFDFWSAFYRVEPFGHSVSMAAKLCEYTAKGTDWKKTNGTDWDADDFLPVRPRDRLPDDEELERKINHAFFSMGGVTVNGSSSTPDCTP